MLKVRDVDRALDFYSELQGAGTRRIQDARSVREVNATLLSLLSEVFVTYGSEHLTADFFFKDFRPPRRTAEGSSSSSLP